MAGVPDYTKGVRVLAGSIPSQRLGTLSIITKTYGTIPSNRAPSASGTLAGARSAGSIVRGTLGNLRLPRSISVGTLTGLFNAGSLNRGTIPAQALQTLPNIPGTLSIVTKTSGTLNIASRALGTLAASRTQTLPNLTGTLSIVTKISGTLNIATRALGTLANQRLPRKVNVGTVSAQIPAGSLTRGTFGVNRGPSALGSVLKGQLVPITWQGQVGVNATQRAMKMVVPPGKTLRLWAVGLSKNPGSAISSFGGSVNVGMFSQSAGTYYFTSTMVYQAGNPLASSPAGTTVAFAIRNRTASNVTPAGFWMATLE